MGPKTFLLFFAALLTLLILIISGAFLILQSPYLVNRMAGVLEPFTGYRVRVNDISVDRHLRARIEGLEIESIEGKDFYLSSPVAHIDGKISGRIKVEVEKILLTGPKFTFHLKKDEESGSPFAALENLPPVNLLEIKEGELEIKTGEGRYRLPGLDVTIRDFSPQSGGHLQFKGRLNIASDVATGKGAVEGQFRMARFAPSPSGKGSVRLSLDSASLETASVEKVELTSDVHLAGDSLNFERIMFEAGMIASGSGRQRVAIKDVSAQGNFSYDQKSSRFILTSFKGKSTELGSIEGKCEGTLTPFTWSASLRAVSVDFARLFAFARPFLPEEYGTWTIKGKGAMELETAGRMDGRPTWHADAVLDLKEGGFASGDNLKAGERITGKVHLKLSGPAREQKGRFNVTMNAGEGELLWGRFYRDFRGEKATLSSDGSFAVSPFSASCTGTIDLFGTGKYSFAGDFSPGRSSLVLEGRGVSHSRFFAVFLGDYLGRNYGLDVAEVKGESDFRVTATKSDVKTAVEGEYRVRDGALQMPSRGFSVAGLQLSLPFDLAFPPSETAPPLSAEQGFLAFEKMDAGDLHLDKMHIPLLLSQNTLLIPVQIDLPLFQGTVRLTHFRVESLLSPTQRLDAGIAIEKIDLGAVTEKLLPVTIKGDIEGRLSSITAQSGEWKTRGKILANVFGGQVEVTNVFGRSLFSAGRLVGADINFREISLEEMTNKIEVGKITGLIRGSIDDLTFQYGQPASFVMQIETDFSRKVSKTVSVDAIENLSIVSTGSAAVSGILNSGINRFFKAYPYSRIGIECTLENDVFSLRGTIHEGGKEYLVRRAFLRGIDIVNQNPDNSISFRDMQERLSRIFRSKAETENVS